MERARRKISLFLWGFLGEIAKRKTGEDMREVLSRYREVTRATVSVTLSVVWFAASIVVADNFTIDITILIIVCARHRGVFLGEFREPKCCVGAMTQVGSHVI